jgi:O-acetyl-ADP-ribose deacetylase (regulator of RNase III)
MPGTLIKRIEYPGGKRFEIVVYDLLHEPTDAIVNAANSGLSHGGGVAAAISQAAGRELDEEGDRLVEEHGRVPVGGAVVTTAGKLPFKGVIHAVGPRMGDGDEQNMIVKALWSSFLRAHERGWKSVSFPGVSSGIFSVPHDICARGYLQAVEKFYSDFPDSPVSLLRLVLFEGPLLDAVRQALPD